MEEEEVDISHCRPMTTGHGETKNFAHSLAQLDLYAGAILCADH